MNKYLKILLLVFLIVFSTCFFYFIIPIVMDGIWNYGFGYNMSRGLVPYVDFSMIVPPLFPLILSFFISIVGNHFIIYYVIISFIIVSISYISCKKFGWKGIIIYIMLLLYPYNGYNTFSLLLLFILLTIIDKDDYNEVLVAIVISLMCLTKQTLGIFIIPSIIYAKNKKKTICVYLFFFLLLLEYLFINNNLYQFIDYCFLGMLDFTEKNNTGVNFLIFLEVGLCLIMLYIFVKSKFKNKKILYILLFQIICFPIVDNSHFSLTVCPIIYYVYSSNNKYIIYVCTTLAISFIIGFGIYIFKGYRCYFYNNSGSFINHKCVTYDFLVYFDTINKYTNKYSDYRLYLFDTRAYAGKLEFNIRLDKYDLINNGNMGYNGSYKYLEEVKEYCDNNKCLFIVNANEAMTDINQSNKYIIQYVMDNYYNISSSALENVYINKM